MITLPKDSEAQWEAAQAFQDSENGSPIASGSRAAPPPFVDFDGGDSGNKDASETDALLPSNNTSELGPPPGFAPYEAEYFEIGYEDIVSHDNHLNSDGEALYRFLIERAQRPPFNRIHCRGTHSENKTRWVTRRGEDGRSRSQMESYTETITDFDFCVDILQPSFSSASRNASEPVHWSVGDADPAYRGRMVREVEVPGGGGGKRKAKRAEVKAYKKWEEERLARGLPPWCTQADVDEGWVEGVSVNRNVLRSSKTLRQWADEYCASPKFLKEFVYEQELYGWNMQQIESAVRSSIGATPYNGCLTVDFTMHRSKIYIRPDNHLSRMLSNKWLKFLSIILLIFPFIWLFKRFHSRGGGTWQVCGGAYPLKKWVPAEESDIREAERNQDNTAPPSYVPFEDDPHASPWQTSSPRPLLITDSCNRIQRASSSSSRFMHTPTGDKKLLGLREGEWFRKWEGAITRAVMGRYKSSEPLPESPFGSAPSVLLLDGYLG